MLRRLSLAMEAVMAMAFMGWIYYIWLGVEQRQIWTPSDIAVVAVFCMVISVIMVSAPFVLWFGLKAWAKYWWTH